MKIGITPEQIRAIEIAINLARGELMEGTARTLELMLHALLVADKREKEMAESSEKQAERKAFEEFAEIMFMEPTSREFADGWFVWQAARRSMAKK